MPRRVLRQCLRLALYLQQRLVLGYLSKYAHFPRHGVDSCGRNRDYRIRSCDAKGKKRDHRNFVVPDGVTSAKTNPLWDRSVLLLRLSELLLRSERLVALRLRISC